MYTLTPETLIRIEDASDPKRGFILKTWNEIRVQLPNPVWVRRELMQTGECGWQCFRLIHPDAITEVE